MSSCDLLLWRNPIESGKVLGGILVGLLIIKKVNLITFVLRVIYTVMLTTASVEFLSKLFLGQGLVTKYAPSDCVDIVSLLKPRIDECLKQLPALQTKARKLALASSPKCTFKAAGVFYVLHKFFGFFSLWTILFVGTIGAFTLPFVYQTYQKEIDATVAHGVEVGKAQASALQSTVTEKASPYVKQLDEKLGPVSKFVKSKLPATRTAGSTVTPESTTAKLAADVPLEAPATAKTSSADFPTAPSTTLGQSIKEEVSAASESYGAQAIKE
ncbi:LAFE_0H04940g1_1 [Lachancea fermentati]|uniref:Reticulon-like protein n=1 Tax=Lachancea fermentati TaxID=4955 RepID=A0A1G4MJK5_LACFM|nr:LAFE_0H04940g1_1 [Lachancea fermentati]